MPTISEYHFDPNASTTAKKLDELSNKELFDRYFIPTDDNNWGIAKDATDAVASRYKNLNKYKYEKVRTLNGDPLNYFVTTLDNNVTTYIPEGYKFNMEAIIADLEKILCENVEHTRTISRTKQVDFFLKELSTYFMNFF